MIPGFHALMLPLISWDDVMPMCQCGFVASREIALYPVVRVKRVGILLGWGLSGRFVGTVA